MRRERMAQGMRRRAVRQTERAAQPLHGQLHDTRRKRPAARADKQWAIRRKTVRAKREIVGDQFADLWKHRNHAGFVALSCNSQSITAGGVLALEAEGLRDAQ